MVTMMLWAAALLGAPPTESDVARAKAAICVARAKCAPPAAAAEAKPSQVVYREVWHTDARGRLVRELVPCSDGTCAK
jgi:hypothetical protein